MHTDPLTGARYPDSTDTPDVSAYIQNAVNDLSDHVGGNFTTTAARDSAFTAWVAQGNSMVNGLQCRVAGYPQVYRGGSWHGVTTQVFLASTVDSTVYTNSATVMTLSIPDPQCPYKIEAYGSVLLSQLGAGVTVRGHCRVNGTIVNPKGFNTTNSGGTTISDILLNAGPAMSATLSGASTVDFWILKEAGAAGNGFQASSTGNGSQFWELSAKVLPV